MAGRHHVEPLQRIGFVAGAQLVEKFGGIRKLPAEGCGDFSAYFIAAATNGRPDGREQVRAQRVKGGHHRNTGRGMARRLLSGLKG